MFKKLTIALALLASWTLSAQARDGYGTDLLYRTPTTYQVGDYGQLPQLIRVVSKVSDSECLAYFCHFGGRRYENSPVFLLRGFDFTNAVDDAVLDLRGRRSRPSSASQGFSQGISFDPGRALQTPWADPGKLPHASTRVYISAQRRTSRWCDTRSLT
jgi:hypothetical protein